MIERAIDKLARRHGAHINEYDANNGADNARRLTGKNGMPHIRDFTAGTLYTFLNLRFRIHEHFSGLTTRSKRNV